MPSDTDIAIARFLVKRKILPKPVLQAALAEVDRVAKLGLEKYLLTVLVEQRRLTQQQAAQLKSLAASGQLDAPKPQQAPPPEAIEEVSIQAALAEAEQEEAGAPPDESGELLEAADDAVSIEDALAAAGEAVEPSEEEDGELLDTGDVPISIADALADGGIQAGLESDESGELIEPARPAGESSAQDAPGDAGRIGPDESGELIETSADAPLSVQEVLEALEEGEAAPDESGDAAPAVKSDSDLLKGVHACARCGAVVDDLELETGVAAHVAGRLYCSKCLSSELEGGEVAAGYRIGAQLFTTRLGHVYKCKHLATGRVCAVEVIPEEALAGGIPLNRLVQLGSAAAEFEQANLLRLHQVVHWQKHVYIERAYAASLPLPVFIQHRQKQNSGPFPVRFTMKVLQQLMQALCFAFDKGLVHGGIAPEVVYINPQGDAKIADLGLPPLGPPQRSNPFVAPELRGEGGAIDCRVDIYAVGMVIHEMLTLEPPPAERSGPLEAPEHTPTFVDDIVAKMTAFSARDRYSTPRAAMKDIEYAVEKLSATVDKVRQVNAELDQMQKTLAASHQRSEAMQKQLDAFLAKREAAVAKLQRAVAHEPGPNASRAERKEFKRKAKEVEQRIAALDKKVRTQTKDLKRTLQHELSKQRRLQVDIGKRIEERHRIEQEGWQAQGQ